MKPENIVMGFALMSLIITIGILAYTNQISSYNIIDADENRFSGVRTELSTIHGANKDVQSDIFGQTVTDSDAQDASIAGAFKTAKTTFQSVGVIRNATTEIVKDANWDGLDVVQSYGMMVLGVLMLMFIAYFLRGWKPQN